MGAGDETVPDRITVNVIEERIEFVFILNSVFPKPPLPNVTFTMLLAGCGCRFERVSMTLLKRSGESHFDQSYALGIVIIANR